MNSALKPHRGVLILVLGILSFFVCGPLAIASWIMANADLAEMDAGRMDPEGRGMTQAGKIIGIITIAFWVLSIVVIGILAAFGVLAAAAQQ
jgi:hypothetical protein